MKMLGLAVLAVVMSAPAQAATCESLLALSLPHTTVTLAQSVAAGGFSPPAQPQGRAQPSTAFQQLPAFCRVAATLRPSSGSEIRIEVWMPLAGWNGKFQGVGNGGYAGTITYTAGSGGLERGMAEALRRGYATASTDTGHSADSGSAFLGEPVKLTDYGYRAVHEMTVAAKAIVAAFYGADPKFSYWNGCSLGGRQGLMEAQRFPEDYDGIIAGAPANPQTRLSVWNVYAGQAALKDPASTIPASKFPMIHRAVVQRCDAADGLKDGLISDPSRCSFDFESLACNGKEDSASCLTTAQVATARMLTSPAVHPRSGETIFPGLALGTELGWATRIGGPAPNPLGADFVKYAIYRNPDWDWRTFDLETAVVQADRLDGIDASADLRAFRQRGGKLLLYHGWADQNFSAQSTIGYYRRVVDTVGSAPQTADWLRLFLAPGMEHCGGGDGLNTFDMVAALEGWVENNQPPALIVASQSTNGKLRRTRPLCPFPQVAEYTGTNSPDEAENFRCVMP